MHRLAIIYLQYSYKKANEGYGIGSKETDFHSYDSFTAPHHPTRKTYHQFHLVRFAF